MAYKSSFIGTFDKESNTSKAGDYTSPFVGTFASKKKRQEEEDANRSYAEELRAEQKKAEEQKKNDNKNILERTGDVIGGAVGFVKDAANDIKDTAVGAYQGVERVLKGQAKAGELETATALADRLNKERNAYMETLQPADYDKPEVKAKLAEYQASADKIMGASKTIRDSSELKDSQEVDATKTAFQAAETVLNVGTLGIGTGGKQLAKQGVKQGIKTLVEGGASATMKRIGKQAALDATIGAAYGVTNTGRNNPDATLEDYAKNVALGASIGAAVPILGSGAAKVLKAGDKAAGKVVSKTITSNDEKVANALTQIGENGIMGTLNKSLSRTATKATYAVSDIIGSTKVGSKIIDMKDDFMSKWVSEFSPLYKTLKRSDFEGKTTGAYMAAREAIGNSNRALSYAQDFIESNPRIQRITGSLAARDKNLVKSRASFDEYAKVRSELDLVKAGKKEFSKGKVAELNTRMQKFKDGGFEKEYDDLVGFYKDINDMRLKEGLISKAQYDDFAANGYDYVRQQRELPDWMLDKPGNKTGGSTASITGSAAVQKRSKYASAELLSPMETAIKTAQLAHVEAYRNKAAKTVYGLLDEAGEAKLIRSTDIVREKQGLLTALKESKPIVTKLNRTIRTNKNAVNSIKKEITQLNKSGRKELSKELNTFIDGLNQKASKNLASPMDSRKVMEQLLTIDSTELRKLRRMIESRNTKMGPILDKIELLNRDLADLHAQRSGMWNQANSMKTTVNKANQTTMSFLDDGVENVAKIDPVIASAIHNWDKQSQNVMNEVLRFSNNVFKYGTTGANVGFALPNFVADQIGSAINSKSVLATHSPRNFVHSFMMTIGKPMNAEDAAILQKFMSANKGQTSINQYTKAATSDKIANKLVRKSADKGTKAYTLIRNPKEAMRALFDAVEAGVGLTENVTRVQNYRGTYKKAVKEGVENASKIANLAARENSVDFLEMGSYGRVVNSLIPYFNASIQGSRTMLRNAAERPASFMAKTTAMIGVPIAATTIWNTSDPERKAIYDTIPDYIKETNFVVITPGAKWNESSKKWDGVIMMKKPPGFKEFAEPVRKFIEYKADDPNADMSSFLADEGGSLVADFASATQPIDFSSPNKFLSSVTPQLLKPTAEAILNKNFFTGEDIVSDSMSELAPADQKYENYSQLTSHIAALFNTSPLKVDSWIKGTFGEVGTNAQYYTDKLVLGASPEATGGRSLTESVTRRFAGAAGGADTDAFYSSYGPASSDRRLTSSKITELIKAGRINEAKRRAQEYNAKIKPYFEDFMKKYAKSPNYDEKWDERINDLYIPITDQSFKARASQK